MVALLYSLILLSFAAHDALAVECNGNVTISNASDAKEVRENCKVIGGNLIFLSSIGENINLDGLEEVHGTWRHSNPYDYNTAGHQLFNVSSSTLQFIGEKLDLWRPNGLERLLLPSLENVTGSIYLDSMANLTHIDFTKLKYIRDLEVEAPKLQEFKVDELKGFTANNGGGIFISDGGKVENLDGLFKGPIAPLSDDALPTITIQKIHYIKHLTLGWKHILRAQISGHLWYLEQEPYPNITLTLGGPDSETVRIEELELRPGIIGVERGSKTSNLSIGNFKSMNDRITDLRLPFHQVSDVAIRGDRMTSLEFPTRS